MVRAAPRAGLVCALALLSIFSVHARDLAAYHIGDTAEEDILTPVPLDVMDADAAAASRAAEALKIPAIIRSNPGVTNAMAGEVAAAFAQAHANFLAGLQETFHQRVLDEPAVLSPKFSSFITTFNFNNQNFPVNPDLARRWARGEDGLATQASMIELLAKTMRRPVLPDDLPADFTSGDTVRLVLVRDLQAALTVSDAARHGQVVNRASVLTLAQLRALFLRNFPADDQASAGALAAFLRPNCEPDVNLTRQVRERQASQLVVVRHYDPGQMIVRRGQTIDSNIQAALGELSRKLPPGPSSPPAAAASGPQNQAPLVPARDEWLLAALAALFAVGLLVFRQRRRRRRVSLLPERVADLPPHHSPALPAELAPHLAETIRSVMVRELAAQRRELLDAHEAAAAEIAGLIRRMDQARAPLQERLRAYEARIQELEKELAARSAENRELLQLKIEMTRRQFEAERAGGRLNFN